MNTLLITGVVLLSIIFPFPVQSTTTPLIVSKIAPEAPKIAQVDTSSPEWVKARIKAYADFYDQDYGVMDAIVKAESNYNPEAIGDSGKSHGLVQIFLPAHKEVTKEQAHNIDFSLDFLAKNLKAGKCRIWTTCPTS
jgi:hypothetical protein